MSMRIERQTLRLEVENANLLGSKFHDVKLSQATFDDVNLSSSTFNNVNLSRIRVTDANLSHADISESCVEGMRINGILVTDLLAAYRRQCPAME
jgi:uncharacterized protein YjbI with pentapeptide repeats